MAINIENVTVQAITGGDTSPAPSMFTIYYDGAAKDFKDSASLTELCEKWDIHVGDACIIRFKTVEGEQQYHNYGLFTGAADAITLEVATMAALP